MELRRFLKSDYDTITTWYKARKLNTVPSLFLPEIGFIVDGVAAGFLIQTDASFCILEPFIANPDASEEDRDKALSSILAELVNKARRLKYEGVFGFSAQSTMLKRAIKQDFEIMDKNSTTIYKGL